MDSESNSNGVSSHLNVLLLDITLWHVDKWTLGWISSCWKAVKCQCAKVKYIPRGLFFLQYHLDHPLPPKPESHEIVCEPLDSQGFCVTVFTAFRCHCSEVEEVTIPTAVSGSLLFRHQGAQLAADVQWCGMWPVIFRLKRIWVVRRLCCFNILPLYLLPLDPAV